MNVFFLDAAAADDVAEAASSGIVSGVTTNPSILRACAPDTDPVDTLLEIFTLFPAGPIFYQVHARDAKAGSALVEDLLERVDQPERVVFKLPAQLEWFAFGADLVKRDLQVAFTAVYQPGQYLAAARVGATHVIPYVDRARRLRPDAGNVVEQLARHRRSGGPAILAASIKSAAQALDALEQGADAITAPWSVLRDLLHDELTDSAVAQFRADVPW